MCLQDEMPNLFVCVFKMRPIFSQENTIINYVQSFIGGNIKTIMEYLTTLTKMLLDNYPKMHQLSKKDDAFTLNLMEHLSWFLSGG